MRKFILIGLFTLLAPPTLLTPARAAATPARTFADVIVGTYLGIDDESGPVKAAALADATAFVKYRRFPETPDAAAFRAACADATFNRFCPYLADGPRERPPETPRELRNSFFGIMQKLDVAADRAKVCPTVTADLTKILDVPDAAAIHSRALYWVWVCAGLTGDRSLETKSRDDLWRRFPQNHLTLAAMTAAKDPRLADALNNGAAADWVITPRTPADAGLNELLRGIETLVTERKYTAADQILARADRRLREAPVGVRLYVGALSVRVGLGMRSVHPAWRALVPLIGAHREFLRRPVLESLYPPATLWYPAFKDVTGPFDQFDFIGLVHLESALNPNAASESGAYGLTQLLIPTATDRWRELARDPTALVTREMLYVPDFAIRLGAFDLSKRIATFAGDVRLAFAGYHAGETAVKRWLNEVPPFTDPEVRAQSIFLNREKAQRSAEYVMNVQSRAAWYRLLYPRP